MIPFHLRNRSHFCGNQPSQASKQSNKQTVSERLYNTVCSVGLCNELCPRENNNKYIPFFKMDPGLHFCLKVLWQRLFDSYNSQLGWFRALCTAVYCFPKGCYLATACKKLLVL